MTFEDEMNFKADHEARGIAKIVSEGRPQAVRTANRIARTKKSGPADYTRSGTRGADPSATKTVGTGVAKPAREIRKSSRGWESPERSTLSTDVLSAAMKLQTRRLSGPSARLAPATIRSPRVGVNIGLVSLEPET